MTDYSIKQKIGKKIVIKLGLLVMQVKGWIRSGNMVSIEGTINFTHTVVKLF